MFAAPEAGFVFLSAPKTASTSIESVFLRHAAVAVRRPPGMKHMTVRTFNRTFVPLFRRNGFPREAYEVVCLIREPVDLAVSWWKYRSREGIADSSAYTGDMSFEDFAQGLLTKQIKLGRTRDFVRDGKGGVGVDRMFKYEHLAECVAWLAERLDVEVPALPERNVSPSRPAEVSDDTRAALEELFAPEVELYRSAH